MNGMDEFFSGFQPGEILHFFSFFSNVSIDVSPIVLRDPKI
jgi:hypothetical protein